jgi:ferredoxin
MSVTQNTGVASNAGVTEAIRSAAAAVLGDGRAKLVLGFRQRSGRRIPALLSDPQETQQLVWDSLCVNNLAAYLRKKEVREMFPVAVVARPAVMRSLIVLQAESQIAPDQVLVLAAGENEFHGILTLAETAALLKDKYAALMPEADLLAKIKELAAMTPQERAAFWSEQFDKCTRCNACRAACPGCYCQLCAARKNVPQWISTVAGGQGSFAWNIMRAYHQAGRCTLCGACQAACPQGIPLMLLNLWIEQQVEEEFDFKAGYDPEGKPLIGSWKPDDDDSFMR